MTRLQHPEGVYTLTELVAYWVMQRPEGATSSDIHRHFCQFTEVSSGEVLQALRQAKRYEKRVWQEPVKRIRGKHDYQWRIWITAVGPNPKRARRIHGYNPQTGAHVEFDSMNAVETEGFCQTGVKRCIKGSYKSHAGFIWSEIPLEPFC